MNKLATLILDTIEKSPFPVKESELLSKCGVSHREAVKAVSTLSTLGLIRAQNSETGDLTWADQSKFSTRKRISFDPARLEFLSSNPKIPICSISPDHKSNLVKGLSSIPFFLQATLEQKDAEFQRLKYAFDRAFETVLVRSIVQKDESPLHSDQFINPIPNSRYLFEFTKSIASKNSISVPDIQRLNLLALGARDLDSPVGFREKEVFIHGSLYVPPKSKASVEFFTNLTLANSVRITSPIDRAFYLHNNIAYVQPFFEGNKRTSVLASNVVLYQAGLAPFSPSISSKDNFLNSCLDYFEYGDTEAISDFFCRSMLQTSQEFEALFDQYLLVLSQNNDHDIRQAALEIAKTAFANKLDPLTLLDRVSPGGHEGSLEWLLQSEIGSIVFKINNLNNDALIKENPELVSLKESFRKNEEESKFEISPN